MNWEALGAVAELIAALGVIITLLYLAMQIKEQTKESKLAATRDLARDWTEALQFGTGDEWNFELYQRAVNDYASLSGGDRIRAYIMLSSAMRIIEIQHFHVSAGNFEPTMFTAMEYRVKQLIELPGVRYWWKDHKEQFSEDFIAYVERVSTINVT